MFNPRLEFNLTVAMYHNVNVNTEFINAPLVRSVTVKIL